MFDVDKFIECIHNNNAIWETSSKEYMDRNIKARSWVIVGKAVYEDWDELSTSDKDNRVKDLKNRWRHIRDGYSKFLNHGKSGQSAKKKTFAYSESLTFLQQVLVKRKTSSNIEDRADEDDEDNISVGENEMENTQELLSTSVTSIPNATSSGINTRAKKKRTYLNPFKTALLQRFDSLNNENDIDPDKAFLLSVLPDYKSLDQSKKIDFRQYILDFFKNQNSFTQQNTHPPQLNQYQNYSKPAYNQLHHQPFTSHHPLPQQYQHIPPYQHQYQYAPNQDHYQSLQHNFDVPGPSSVSAYSVNEETPKDQ